MLLSKNRVLSVLVVSVALSVGLVPARTGWCQESSSELRFSRLLETAVRRSAAGRAGFRLCYFPTTSPLRPKFEPIKGLDDPNAVPFLTNVLRNGPDQTQSPLFLNSDSMYFHISRCYAALCLGSIGDSRSFEPLLDIIEDPQHLGNDAPENQLWVQEYPLSDFAALALGYLGDPRALQPLLRLLSVKGQEYEYAAFALAELGEIRAVRPLILHASRQATMNARIHYCLEDLTHAYFPIKYVSGERKYRVPDFPELGQLSPDKVYLALWEHWSRHGEEFAQNHFEKMHAVWKRRRDREDRDFGDPGSESRLFKEIVRGGLITLPYVMDEIDKGDESLVPYIAEFVAPVRGKQINRGLRPEHPGLSTRAECLEWWQNNQTTFRMEFRGEGRD